jgi:hypothetical protein
MIDLPEIGDRVKVWPMPGRFVLTGPFHSGAALLTQGQRMPKGGLEIVWDHYWFAQLREGAILMHAPPCEEHDHGDDGIDDCRHCGRTLSDAQVYDVHRAAGMAAAKLHRASAEAAAKAGAEEHKRARDERIREVRAAADKARAAAVAAVSKLEAPPATPESMPAPSLVEDARISPPPKK